MKTKDFLEQIIAEYLKHDGCCKPLLYYSHYGNIILEDLPLLKDDLKKLVTCSDFVSIMANRDNQLYISISD